MAVLGNGAQGRAVIRSLDQAIATPHRGKTSHQIIRLFSNGRLTEKSIPGGNRGHTGLGLDRRARHAQLRFAIAAPGD